MLDPAANYSSVINKILISLRYGDESLMNIIL